MFHARRLHDRNLGVLLRPGCHVGSRQQHHQRGAHQWRRPEEARAQHHHHPQLHGRPHGDDLSRLRDLKTATGAQMGKGLESIGFSHGLVAQAAASHGPEEQSLLTADRLKRAESWQVNLDPDKDRERVVQVWFQSEAPLMAFKAVFLILVLDADSQGGRPLGEYLFALDGCTYASDKAMTLAFAPARDKPYQEIRFAVDRATSCGTYVEITSRRDVVAFDEKTARLQMTRGKEKADGVDRLQLAE